MTDTTQGWTLTLWVDTPPGWRAGDVSYEIRQLVDASPLPITINTIHTPKRDDTPKTDNLPSWDRIEVIDATPR